MTQLLSALCTLLMYGTLHPTLPDEPRYASLTIGCRGEQVAVYVNRTILQGEHTLHVPDQVWYAESVRTRPASFDASGVQQTTCKAGRLQ